MIPFQHILVPVDFGDAMEPALDLAIPLARRFESQITLVHAFDPSPFTQLSPFAPAIDMEPILAALERQLKDLCEATKAKWPRVDALVVRGSPWDAVLEVAKTRGCDLLVVGTHGRRGVARALLGSVAERIVRLAPIPVLTVHPAPRADKAATAA